MRFFYTLLTQIVRLCLPILALFNTKLKQFVSGRKNVIVTLQKNIKKTDNVFWFHAASLGEYEQGLPVIQEVKKKFPNHKIVLTFFSPSGYEVRKNNAFADITVYLPLDTKRNAKKFIDIVHPEKVFFIKYEFWINYLTELKERNIATYLISGIFRKNQLFFKPYGSFYKRALQAFTHFFVQNSSSKELLQSIGFTNVTVSGDTRFDRVATILEKDNTLPFIKAFKDDKTTVVIGSSWAKDEDILVTYINECSYDVKFIIAPHVIKPEAIQRLKKSITKKVVLFSKKEDINLQEYDVFIIDTIGILTKIYSYADMAYVGGGFGNPGIHNILEPATFGVPLIIGPNYTHFAEAIALVNAQGCKVINNQIELNETFNQLLSNDDERKEIGHICETFVQMNKGATNKILATIYFK